MTHDDERSSQRPPVESPTADGAEPMANAPLPSRKLRLSPLRALRRADRVGDRRQREALKREIRRRTRSDLPLEDLFPPVESPGERKARVAARREAAAAEKAAARAAADAKKSAGRPEVVMQRTIEGALADARGLAGEVAALLSSLDPRARSLVARRWGLADQPAPTLEALGAELGVSRERVRQIVALFEDRLRAIRPPLPCAARAVTLLQAAGGVLTDAQFEQMLAQSGLEALGFTRMALLPLSALGLIPRIAYLPEVDAWVDEPNAVTWANPRVIEIARATFFGAARRAYRRLGCVPAAVVDEAAPMPPLVALRLVDRTASWSLHHEAWLPTPSASNSTLLRSVRRILAVTGPLSVADLRAGLLRGTATTRPLRVRESLLVTLLSRYPDVLLDRGRAHLRGPIAKRDEPTSAELPCIKVFEQHGGVLTLYELAAALSAGGHSPAILVQLPRFGYLTQLGPTLWAVRGRAVPPAFQAARARPDGRRHRTLAQERWSADESRGMAYYRTRYPAMLGALSLPRRVREAIAAGDAGEWSVTTNPAHWTSAEMRVTPTGHLWSLRHWLTATAPGPAQHVVADIDIRNRAITLSLADPDSAQESERQWREERSARAQAVKEARAGRQSAQLAEAAARREEARAANRAARLANLRARLEAALADPDPADAPDIAEMRRRIAYLEARVGRASNPRPQRQPRETVWTKDVGWSFEVPNRPVSLDTVRYFRLIDVPARGSALLVAVLTDYAFPPEVTGMVMALLWQLSSRRGMRRGFVQPLESAWLDAAEPLDPAEAARLVPNVERAAMLARRQVAWREFVGGQLGDPGLAGLRGGEEPSAPDSGDDDTVPLEESGDDPLT